MLHKLLLPTLHEIQNIKNKEKLKLFLRLSITFNSIPKPNKDSIIKLWNNLHYKYS